MKKLLSTILAIFFSSSNLAGEPLVEFSTAMDFEEFDVVLKNLTKIDGEFGREITTIIKAFQKSSKIGEHKKVNFKTVTGYVLLEKEDDYAFTIATFTPKKWNLNIDKAYELGSAELGI